MRFASKRDELRSRSRICLDLMIFMEQIEMEESQVESKEN